MNRVETTPRSAGWTYCGLTVFDLAPGESRRVDTADAETLVLPLAGSCTVEVDDLAITLSGRPDVFAGPTDFVYLPRDSTAAITSAAGATLALPSAVCTRRLPPRHVPAADVPVELRGAGTCSRQVNNFCTPESFEADRLIACEVLTPGGNWSSYPPHKHDEAGPEESELEEIYYFRIARGGMGYQRVYPSPGGGTDILREVRTDDVILIPNGWHGPSMATPGYDMYYLNVMAGPGERRWRITDDPAHTWIRGTWEAQETDPRLPFGS